MHTRFRAKGLVLAALTALLVLPSALLALPKPGQPGRGFRLAARAIGAITINRVYCGLASSGEVCVDSTNSPSIGGGFWPKGSPMQYVFNSGLQMAGVVDSALTGFGWAGDTTGAMFFNARGDGHGNQVEPVWNSSNPSDAASWPDYARVPKGVAAGGDAQGDLFDVSLQGAVSASEGDVWTMAWDGDPSSVTGRPHPLGIAVETRGLGWNFPTGNGDVVYFIYTFYNITSSDEADYATVRPELRPKLAALGATFQATNNAAFNVTIPTHGYTIRNFYADIAADMDVSDATVNYASVNLPFALGYTYEQSFSPAPGNYSLPPDIGGNPFTGGFGFVGVKYLRTPIDPATSAEAGIRLFSNTINATGAFNDPRDVQQLYRFLSGTPNTALGDGNCNTGDPTVTRICYVENGNAQDMRFFQSSGPFDLPPGTGSSIVVGYIFASPVSVAGCAVAGCGGAKIKPGDATRLSDAARLVNGANLIDSLTGFVKWTDAGALNGQVEQSEFTVVKGSLLGKALVAQAVFDGRFLLPAAPAAPEFFAIPQDNQVALFWRASASEDNGDAYYSAAKNPRHPDLTVNNLYDPNYRQYDVEGYRVYRGRVDDPRSLTLLASFDYASTTFRDYLGVVNPTPDCAPELRFGGVPIRSGCPVVYDTVSPGGTYTVFNDFPISSPFVQVKLGNRAALANGTAVTLLADTAITGGDAVASGTALTDGNIPFVYVDKTAKNNIRYFYSVTAFDVNSVQSGPTSLESARVTKAVTPFHNASNKDLGGGITGLVHRGRTFNTDSLHPADPTIDPATGVFSGPARPATGVTIGFIGDFVPQVLASGPGAMGVTLIGLKPGSSYDGVPAEYSFLDGAGDTVVVSVPQEVDETETTIEAAFTGNALNNANASRYGGSSTYHLKGSATLVNVGNYLNTVFGRGCVNGGGHTNPECGYDGARWFSGANETFAHPTQGNNVNFSNAPVTNATNAGSLPNVLNVYEARSYQTRPNTFRNVEGVLSTVTTAADYRVYWGAAAGTVDSVIDITHDVKVPFATDFTKGYTWGFLTVGSTSGAGSGDGRPGVLSVTDLGCVYPLHTAAWSAANGHLGCAAATTYNFVNTATLGPIVTGNTRATDGSDAPRANPGFGMYLAGHFFLFEMATAATPAPSSTVWTMRSYTGAIDGGGCADAAVCTAGNFGNYTFTPAPSPWTAVGSFVGGTYNVTNAQHQSTEAELDQVHTVPDPYYVQNGYERTASGKVIKFTNLPIQAIIRIYSTSGVLVRVLEHNSTNYNSALDWDVRNRNNQVVASGVYFYAIETPSGARRVGRMTIVNFAQ